MKGTFSFNLKLFHLMISITIERTITLIYSLWLFWTWSWKKPPPQLSGFLVRGCNSKAVRKSSRYFRIYSHYPLDFSGRTELTLNTQWVTGFLKFYWKSWQIDDLEKFEEVNYLCSHIINMINITYLALEAFLTLKVFMSLYVEIISTGKHKDKNLEGKIESF